MKIVSNGSKWAGQAPDTIEKLMEVLENHKLNPHFLTLENDKRFMSPIGGTATFRAHGNFEDISHVFDIRGTLEEMRPLLKAIKNNRTKYGLK